MSHENKEFEKLKTLWSNRSLSVVSPNDTTINDIDHKIFKLKKVYKRTAIFVIAAASSLMIPFASLSLNQTSFWDVFWIVCGIFCVIWGFMRHQICEDKIFDLKQSIPKYKLSEEKTKDILNSLLLETISFDLTFEEKELFKEMNNINGYSQDFVDNLVKAIEGFNNKKQQEILKKKTEQDLAVFFQSDQDADRVLVIQGAPTAHDGQQKFELD